MTLSAPTNGSPWISATAVRYDETQGHPIIGVDMFTIGAPELAGTFETLLVTPGPLASRLAHVSAG